MSCCIGAMAARTSPEVVFSKSRSTCISDFLQSNCKQIYRTDCILRVILHLFCKTTEQLHSFLERSKKHYTACVKLGNIIWCNYKYTLHHYIHIIFTFYIYKPNTKSQNYVIRLFLWYSLWSFPCMSFPFFPYHIYLLSGLSIPLSLTFADLLHPSTLFTRTLTSKIILYCFSHFGSWVFFSWHFSSFPQDPACEVLTLHLTTYI